MPYQQPSLRADVQCLQRRYPRRKLHAGLKSVVAVAAAAVDPATLAGRGCTRPSRRHSGCRIRGIIRDTCLAGHGGTVDMSINHDADREEDEGFHGTNGGGVGGT